MSDSLFQIAVVQHDETNDQIQVGAPNDVEDALWDQKRKLTDEEVKRSIERARLRRAEEERRASEQRQAVCAEKLRQLNLRKQQQQQQQQEQRPKSPEMEMGSPVEPRAG